MVFPLPWRWSESCMAAAVGRMSGHWTCLKNQGTTVSSRQFSIFTAHFPRHQSKNTQTNHTNFHQRLPNIQQIPSVHQESTVATRKLRVTPTLVINYMIIHTPASVVLWTLSVSHKKSSFIHTRSACMPMPWIWRKCRFIFPIRLRTSEQIWHVVSPMCMAICNWQDFLWRKSLLQTPQRNAGLAATDDTLLHQLPTTGGNNHTLVAPIHPTIIPLP